MAYISKFKTDTAYSNSDINDVLSAITGKGVLPSSPNEILSSVAQSGITLSDSQCKVVWSDDEKTSVKVLAGTVIMADGSYIVISDEVLPLSSAELHYVYVYNDLILQNIVKCSTTLPEDKDSFVLLAAVSQGKITDMRHLASSKIANYGTHPVLSLSESFCINKNRVLKGEPFLSFDVGEGYTHLILTTDSKNSVSVYSFEEEAFLMSMFASYDNQYHSGETEISAGHFGQIHITYVNGVISLHSNKDLYSNIDLSQTFNLLVF